MTTKTKKSEQAEPAFRFEAYGRNLVAQAEALGRDDLTVGQAVAGVTGFADVDLDAQYTVTIVKTPTEVSIALELDSGAPRYVAPRFGE